MAAFIQQKEKAPARSVYVKHNSSGHKVIESTELADYLAAGYHEMINPAWRYHKTAGSGIFGEDEFDELTKKGWVDSPAKMVTVPNKPSRSPTISQDEVAQADKYACELLSGKGLSMAALMRKFDLDNHKSNHVAKFKPVYDAIHSQYKKDIKKQGLCWFWTKKSESSEEVEDAII